MISKISPLLNKLEQITQSQNKSSDLQKGGKPNQMIYRKWCLLTHLQASCFLAFSLTIYLNPGICVQIDLSLFMRRYFRIHICCQTYVKGGGKVWNNQERILIKIIATIIQLTFVFPLMVDKELFHLFYFKIILWWILWYLWWVFLLIWFYWWKYWNQKKLNNLSKMTQKISGKVHNSNSCAFRKSQHSVLLASLWSNLNNSKHTLFHVARWVLFFRGHFWVLWAILKMWLFCKHFWMLFQLPHTYTHTH